MVLVTQQLQGTHVVFPSRTLSWTKRLTVRRQVITFCKVVRTERSSSLKHNLCFSVGASRFQVPKVKPSRISAFKGSGQNDESRRRAGASNVSENSAKLSYVSNDSNETITQSTKTHNGSLSYNSESNETIAGSPAIHKLFKKWLTMLLTPLPSQSVDEVLGEEPPQLKSSVTCNETQNKERGGIVKAIWYQFWGLDATIKIPLIIFVPWYLAVNMIYGADVSKELTPLWVFGPLIVALYIKMLRGLITLYIFSFNQTVIIVKNLPKYYLVAYGYIAHGKLIKGVKARAWQPVVDIKNLDYKEISRRKLKELQEWLMEKYLDYVESIWPYYCRTIRFLKRANLI